MCPGDRYVIPDDPAGNDDETWIQPRSIEEIIIDALLETDEYEADDLDPISEYVDYDELEAVLDGEADSSTHSFVVEEHDVTVHDSGNVEVSATE